MAVSVGQTDIRAENVSKAVDGFALLSYRFKGLCKIDKSSAWKESYFQETAADLTGGSGSAVKGIPRLANFPYGEVTHTKKSAINLKHGMDGLVSWEDFAMNDIDSMSRTLLRIARAVTKSVDDEIWDVISESQTPSLINSVTIAAGNEWDSLTLGNQNPIQNILDCQKEIATDNYDAYTNAFLLLSPKDYANLMGNASVRNAAEFFTADVTRNGRVGKLAGATLIVSNNVTADYALYIIGKEACTWKTVSALKTDVKVNAGISLRVRSWEVGVPQLKNPEACCLLINTQKS